MVGEGLTVHDKACDFFVRGTGRKGEILDVPPMRPTLALKRPPSTIVPWHGPARGFSFASEVQPVLDEYCAGCHDGKEERRPNFARDAKSASKNPST